MDLDGARQAYFRFAFANHEGWACIALLRRGSGQGLDERWFFLPRDFQAMLDLCKQYENVHGLDVYFCPQLFTQKTRRKEFVSICPTLWADLDTCPPSALEIQATLITESSPGRYQALWAVDGGVAPQRGMDLSKRIAYQYADLGADRSGWDLTQLLRVPGTRNNKYVDLDSEEGPVVVRIIGDGGYALYREDEFANLPEVSYADYELIPFPETLPADSGRQIMENKRFVLKHKDFERFENTPTGDWSKELFALEMACFEAGMSREEVFRVVEDAKCNKFKRDGLGSKHIWLDVCRAWGKHSENIARVSVVSQPETTDSLLTNEERDRVKDVRTFVEDYIDWASSLGDAAVQYHQGGAFIILSAILGGAVSLPTSFGRIKPNLWFMILADTTLTRKSTAMDIAIDLLAEVDSDAIMATDGSIEGLMQGLSMRPGRPSIFLRDEFSGLIEQITKKDYYAGMAEVLTKLYDGKLQKRLLRKEIIEVRDPNLIVFAGGIKSRVQQLLKFDHVSSGFIPRFLFLTAESDLSKVKPLGPPTELDTGDREKLLRYLIDLKTFYTPQPVEVITPQGQRIQMTKKWDATLDEAAWTRYNEYEKALQQMGLKSERPDLMTPLFDRLAKSTLKAVILLAAVRKRSLEGVQIGLDDMLLGIRYGEGWLHYAVDVINGIGASVVEQQMDTIFNAIKRKPNVSRSVLMRNFHLTAREADAVFQTLEQRGLISRGQVGKAIVYTATP